MPIATTKTSKVEAVRGGRGERVWVVSDNGEVGERIGLGLGFEEEDEFFVRFFFKKIHPSP